jgi:hypothetical protein
MRDDCHIASFDYNYWRNQPANVLNRSRVYFIYNHTRFGRLPIRLSSRSKSNPAPVGWWSAGFKLADPRAAAAKSKIPAFAPSLTSLLDAVFAVVTV